MSDSGQANHFAVSLPSVHCSLSFAASLPHVFAIYVTVSGSDGDRSVRQPDKPALFSLADCRQMSLLSKHVGEKTTTRKQSVWEETHTATYHQRAKVTFSGLISAAPTHTHTHREKPVPLACIAPSQNKLIIRAETFPHIAGLPEREPSPFLLCTGEALRKPHDKRKRHWCCCDHCSLYAMHMALPSSLGSYAKSVHTHSDSVDCE